MNSGGGHTCATEKSEFCLVVTVKLCNIVIFFWKDRCRKLQEADCANYFHAHLASGSLSKYDTLYLWQYCKIVVDSMNSFKF